MPNHPHRARLCAASLLLVLYPAIVLWAKPSTRLPQKTREGKQPCPLQWIFHREAERRPTRRRSLSSILFATGADRRSAHPQELWPENPYAIDPGPKTLRITEGMPGFVQEVPALSDQIDREPPRCTR